MIIQENHVNNYDNNIQDDYHPPNIFKQHAIQFIYIFTIVLIHSFTKLMPK